MKLTLKDGRLIDVKVFHVRRERAGQMCRGTEVVVLDGQYRYSEAALCSPKDNFSKRVGRKLAVTRLLDGLRRSTWTNNDFTKEDRRDIFKVVCPEFNS